MTNDFTELREALDRVRRQAALAPLTYSPGSEPFVIREAMQLAYEAAPALLDERRAIVERIRERCYEAMKGMGFERGKVIALFDEQFGAILDEVAAAPPSKKVGP